MSNEAAKLISEAVLGNDFRTIFIGNKGYTLYPPTIKIICRAVAQWAQLDFDLEDRHKLNTISQIPLQSDSILLGLSYFVTGDVKFHQLKAYKLYLKWRYGSPGITPKEINIAVQSILELIQGQDFFEVATLCTNVAKMVAKQKS